MERLRLAGLVLVSLLVLVLVGSLVAGLGGPAEEPAPVDVGGAPAGERLRVEVLNAGGISGVAAAATDTLRERGFDVVYFGNASGFGRDTSWVLDRVGSLEGAERVAEALGIENFRTAVDTSLYVDVSVVLGRDWPAGRTEEAADTAVR